MDSKDTPSNLSPTLFNKMKQHTGGWNLRREDQRVSARSLGLLITRQE